jgi:hypothetical protein
MNLLWIRIWYPSKINIYINVFVQHNYNDDDDDVVDENTKFPWLLSMLNYFVLIKPIIYCNIEKLIITFNELIVLKSSKDYDKQTYNWTTSKTGKNRNNLQQQVKLFACDHWWQWVQSW